MNGELRDLRDRLSYLFKNKGVTAYTVWKDTGLNQSVTSNALTGKTKKLSRKNLEILAKYFNVPEEWLNSGNSTINSGNQINARDIQGDIVQNVDNRQYYSDRPDVLRAEIDKLNRIIEEKEERIKEKDAQIKEKDAQINTLLDIIKKS